MRNFLRSIYFDGLLYLANRIVSRVPSHSFRLLFYRRVMGFSIGTSSCIFMDAWFDTKGKNSFVVGSNSVVNQKCRLDNRGTIVIGNNVSISAEVCILTADHDPQSPKFEGRTRPVTIGDFAFIGTRAMILPGVWIGEGAVVAAGAVVTKRVEPYTVVGGVPARQFGRRNTELDYSCSYRPLFH